MGPARRMQEAPIRPKKAMIWILDSEVRAMFRFASGRGMTGMWDQDANEGGMDLEAMAMENWELFYFFFFGGSERDEAKCRYTGDGIWLLLLLFEG